MCVRVCFRRAQGDGAVNETQVKSQNTVRLQAWLQREERETCVHVCGGRTLKGNMLELIVHNKS